MASSFYLLQSHLYTMGIWLSTPPAGLLKETNDGNRPSSAADFLVYFISRKLEWQTNERFYANLSKAAMTAFASSIVVLLTLALLLTIMKELYIPGVSFYSSRVLCLLFNFVFMYLEGVEGHDGKASSLITSLKSIRESHGMTQQSWQSNWC